MSRTAYTDLLRSGEADLLATMGTPCSFARRGAVYAVFPGVATQASAVMSYMMGGAELHLALRLTVSKTGWGPSGPPQHGDRVTVDGAAYTLIETSSTPLEGVMHLSLAR